MRVKVSCPGFLIPVRDQPNINGKVTRRLKDGEEFDAYTQKVSGFYKLASGTEFVNSGTKGVGWTMVPGGVICVRILCPGLQIYVRAQPSIGSEPKRRLKDGDEFEAFERIVSGFYQLTDGSGFVNKGTKSVKWEIIPELTVVPKTPRSTRASASNSSSSKAQVATDVQAPTQSDSAEKLPLTPTTASAATVTEEVLSPAPVTPVTLTKGEPTETEGVSEPTTDYFDRLAVEGEKEQELESEFQDEPVEWRTIDQTNVEGRNSNAGADRGSDPTDASQLKAPLLPKSEANPPEDGSVKTKTERDSESKNSAAAVDSKCCGCSIQ